MADNQHTVPTLADVERLVIAELPQHKVQNIYLFGTQKRMLK